MKPYKDRTLEELLRLSNHSPNLLVSVGELAVFKNCAKATIYCSHSRGEIKSVTSSPLRFRLGDFMIVNHKTKGDRNGNLSTGKARVPEVRTPVSSRPLPKYEISPLLEMQDQVQKGSKVEGPKNC